MKNLKTILFVLLLCVAGTLSAQKSTVQREVTDDYVKITRIIPNWDSKHDLRIGIGGISLCALGYLDEGFGMVDYDTYVPSFRQQVKEADRYKMPQIFTGVLSFSYGYHFRRWLQLGGTVNFAAATRVYRDNTTHEKVADYSSYFGSIMPTARFIYLNREKVQLYSSVSLGVSITNYEVLPCYDLTLFGCSFGKSVFGFVEIGNGIGGWGRVGIGYRFNAKKK